MDGEENRRAEAGASQEDRRHPRFEVDGDSSLQFIDLGLKRDCRIADLSLSGCRVVTRDLLPANRCGRLEVVFKVEGVTFRFNGVLRWSDGRRQAGIQFVDVIPRRCTDLAELIEEIGASATIRCSAGPAQRRSPPAPAVPVEPRPAAAQSALVDRRTQIRHCVEASAILILVRSGSEVEGRIVDLSLGGCRLQVPDRFAVDLYTRVEIEFGLRGQRFRLAGVIQAIHNGGSVGMRFLDLSERKRQQITELIDALERIRADRE